MCGHVSIIAGNSIENFLFIHESACQVSTLAGDLEEDVFKDGLTFELDFLAELANATECIPTVFVSLLCKQNID